MLGILWSAAALCIGVTSMLEGGVECHEVVTGMSTGSR